MPVRVACVVIPVAAAVLESVGGGLRVQLLDHRFIFLLNVEQFINETGAFLTHAGHAQTEEPVRAGIYSESAGSATRFDPGEHLAADGVLKRA